MKRRHFVKALSTLPAAAALVAQRPNATPPPGVPANPAPGVPQNSTHPVEPPARAVAELPKIDISVSDAAADAMPRFFTAEQFAALHKLCGILMPAVNKAPGALDAGAPEFLDFLIGDSPAERQHLYRAGLDALNAQARAHFQKPFAEVDDAQAAAVLKPLRQAWTYEPPSDPLARFLLAAKADVRTATVNSRDYGKVAAATSRRGFSGGLYWYPLD
ncbi:MAG: gluconate 2-dehydrogenase subunit 3 family protein [Acidobacteriota bacterium]|nr:gluconate 2-dehydrogenase subunit 3 family protein [Acidobacteriota bacterium]